MKSTTLLILLLIFSIPFIGCDPDFGYYPHSLTSVWNINQRPDSSIAIFGTNSRNFNWSNSLDNSPAPDQVKAFNLLFSETGDYRSSHQFASADLFAVGKYLLNGDYMVFGGLRYEYQNLTEGMWVRKYVANSSLIDWHRDVLYDLPQNPFITSAVCREGYGFAVAGYQYEGGSYVVLIDDEANVAGVAEFEDERSHTFLKDYSGHGVYFLSSSLYYIDNSGNIVTEIPPVSGDSLSRSALAVSNSGSAFVAGLINGTRTGVRQYDTTGNILNQFRYDGNLLINQLILTSDSGFVVAGRSYDSPSKIDIRKLNRQNEVEWQVTNMLRGESEVRDIKELYDGTILVAANESVESSFVEAFLMAVSSSGQILWRRASRVQ